MEENEVKKGGRQKKREADRPGRHWDKGSANEADEGQVCRTRHPGRQQSETGHFHGKKQEHDLTWGNRGTTGQM